MAIVNLYKVCWRNNRHNAANAQKSVDWVAAASPDAVGSTIQTNNNDGKSVTVESIELVRPGIIQ